MLTTALRNMSYSYYYYMELASRWAGIYSHADHFPESEHKDTFLQLHIQCPWTKSSPDFPETGKSCPIPFDTCLPTEPLAIPSSDTSGWIPTFTTSSPSTIFSFSKFSCSSWGFIRHFSKPSKPTRTECRQAQLPSLDLCTHAKTCTHVCICVHTQRYRHRHAYACTCTHTYTSRWVHYRSGWALWSTLGWRWKTHPGSWRRAPQHCWNFDSEWPPCFPCGADRKAGSGMHWHPPSSCCPPGNSALFTSPSQGCTPAILSLQGSHTHCQAEQLSAHRQEPRLHSWKGSDQPVEALWT